MVCRGKTNSPKVQTRVQGAAVRFWLGLALTLTLLIQGMHASAADGALAASFTQAREQMVRQQLEERGISDPVALKAMAGVARHEFVPKSLVDHAYDDGPLPIGYGQTISQPYIVALMTELAEPAPGKRILEIGTGSGYQAAVLAAAGATVFTVEIIAELAAESAARLQRLGYDQVRVRQGDGYFGWEEMAPFDAIVVTAAAPYIPPPLLAQLKESGRMIIPVGSPFFVQTLMLVEKQRGQARTRSLMPVRFVPFRRGR